MIRVKTFDATAIAPNGVLYAGDLNAVQDAAAALTDFSQAISLGSVLIGDNTLQLFKYGAGEVRLTSALRTDGIVRALGGSFTGSFTTTQRDAIPAGSRPYGLAITNTTTNRLEWNSNTDASPTWRPVAADGGGSILVSGDISAQYGLTSASQIGDRGRGAAGINFGAAGDSYIERQGVANIRTNSSLNVIISGVANPFLYYVSGEANPRWYVEGNTGKLMWGPGGGTAVDTWLARTGVNQLRMSGAIFSSHTGGAGSGIYIADSIAAGNIAATYPFGTKAGADIEYRFLIRGDGVFSWGPGGSTTQDTFLYRSAAATLFTPGAFSAGGAINSTSTVGGSGFLSTAHYYNRIVNAVYYFGTGDDMWFQRDAGNNRIVASPNFYTGGLLTAGGVISSATEIIARAGGGNYTTNIGYIGVTGYAGISFADGLTAVSRQIDGVGTAFLHHYNGSTGGYQMINTAVSVGWGGAPSHTIHVSGDVYASGGFTSSDDRFKEAVNSVANGSVLDRLLKLEGKSYKRVGLLAPKNSRARLHERTTGFLGSQVQKYFPELISLHDEIEWKTVVPKATKKNPHPEGRVVKASEYKNVISVNYIGFIPYLVEGMREISDRLAALEQRIN